MKTQSLRKTVILISSVLFIFLSLVKTEDIFAQETDLDKALRPIADRGDDKTLSPYFFVKSNDKTVDQMPLKETKAEVNIAGVIADVIVTQVYVNNGKKALEASYIFPSSTKAAVYAMQMKIGKRLLIAKIEEKAKARKDYEQAKSEGKSASLLEQERPNVFRMDVANIMPGDTISVELRYTELLVPEDGVYEFVYPTVVGPRYSNKTENEAGSNENWIENPYTSEGKKPLYSFDLKANINAGMKIKAVSCPTHRVNTSFPNENTAQLKLKKSQNDEGNRDFILQYKLADNTIESGLLLYKDKETNENFFLTMIQVPNRPKIESVPPREFIFIMDISGSMGGFPIETEKKLLENLINNLRPVDKFNVMLFAGGSSILSDKSIPATKENLKSALKMINEQSGGGSTEILPALKKALALPKTEGFSRTFVISTDGYVTVENEVFDLIRKNLNNSNFFTFGIGSSVNRFILEGMANVGKGESFIVTEPNQCGIKAEKFRNYIQTPVLIDIKANYGKFEVYDVEPENIPDALAERPIIIYGKWNGNPSGIITIKGKTGNEEFIKAIDVSQVKPMEENIAIKYLWAREKIKMLDDYNQYGQDENLVSQVTNLGLKYNLLTNYTSFVALDSVVRNKSGEIISVKQPLPMPQGVSNLAIESVQLMCLSSVSINYCESLIEEDIIVDETAPVYSIVEKMPEYIGGEQVLMRFLADNLIYPEEAKKNKVNGKVFVEFTVDRDGSISDIKIIRGIGSGCDEEVMRVIALTSGMWKPGQQGGIKVRTQMVLPVVFN